MSEQTYQLTIVWRNSDYRPFNISFPNAYERDASFAHISKFIGQKGGNITYDSLAFTTEDILYVQKGDVNPFVSK